MDNMKNTEINNADIMTGDIVTLKDGRRGKTIAYIESGKYAIISGKNKEPTYFHIDAVIKIVRKPLKRVRIYQIEPLDADSVFRNYESVKAKQRNAPPAELYKVVFDGILDTNKLEDIFYIFNMKHPEDYKGRSLSVSDIVELYDSKGSRYFYCDNMGFKKIKFKPVQLQYMLLSCTEREIYTPLFFTFLEQAQKRMKNELLKQLGSFEDYTENEDYGLDSTSAWANVRCNSDWKILTVGVNKARNIMNANINISVE